MNPAHQTPDAGRRSGLGRLPGKATARADSGLKPGIAPFPAIRQALADFLSLPVIVVAVGVGIVLLNRMIGG